MICLMESTVFSILVPISGESYLCPFQCELPWVQKIKHFNRWTEENINKANYKV